jgi:hypothetical protein
LSKKLKIRICKTVSLPVVLYGWKIWTKERWSDRRLEKGA